MINRGLLEMIFCFLKLKGEDYQKDFVRYKLFFGGIRSKVMFEIKFKSF